MNTTLRTIALSSILLGASTLTQAADDKLQVLQHASDAVDLAQIAHEADMQNKRAILLISQGECRDCDKLGVSLQAPSSQYAKHYQLIQITAKADSLFFCPAGDEFNRTEFMNMKGIQASESLVFIDQAGNVTSVYNGVINDQTLERLAAKHLQDTQWAVNK